MASVSACSDKGLPGRFASALPGQEEQQQHSVTDGGGLSALLERSFIGMRGFDRRGRRVWKLWLGLLAPGLSLILAREVWYFSRFPRRRPFIYLKPPYAIESVPSL